MAYVLIVDDDQDFANAISIVLTRHGHETRVEHNPSDALGAMGRRRPDLAIVDLMFPEDAWAGVRLIRSVRHRHDLKGLPILILTAVNTTEPLGFTRQVRTEHPLAATDLMQKPLDFDRLIEKVAQLLSGAGEQR